MGRPCAGTRRLKLAAWPIGAFLLAVDEDVLCGRDPFENGARANGRKRAVFVCIALQFHLGSPLCDAV
jgi:hypothetical protein